MSDPQMMFIAVSFGWGLFATLLGLGML
jgi:hypothetical protein